MYKKWESIKGRSIENMKGGRGSVFMKNIFLEKDFGSSITHLIFATIPPGSSVGFHDHSGDEEVYFIIEGHGMAYDDEKEYDIGTYDTILTNSGHGHGIKNTGQQDLKMLAIIAEVV